MKKIRSLPGDPALPRPWVFFSIFLAADLLLSYFSIPVIAKVLVGALGLFLPFVLWLKTSRPIQSRPSFSQEFLPRAPIGLWVTLAALAVAVRFFELTTLSPWPFHDESLWGWMALRFNEHGGGLFPEGARFPAAYLWGLSLLFKWFQPSLFTLWFFPALISTLTVMAGYAAARQFFSRSFSLLIVLILAFSFWPLYLGRVSDQTGLVLLAECAFALMLGLFLRATTPRARQGWALACGLSAGAGFYIFISWATVAFVGGCVVLGKVFRGKPRSWGLLGIFGAGFLLILIPILRAGLGSSFQSYLTGVGLWAGPHDPWTQARISLSYLTVIFWGVDLSTFAFQPVWGGFLDPVLDGFFFLGLAEAWRAGRKVFLGVIATLGLFLLPGMLTSSTEFFRVLPVLPLLILLCAWGWRRLLLAVPPRRSIALLILCGLAFAGLDLSHLFVKYHGIWDSPGVWRGYGKSLERYRAHPILEGLAREKGPGLIYDGFLPGLCDQSLFVTAYSYNAASNPSLSFQEARWAGVLANANYKPFLEKRFPQSRFFALSEGLDRPDGGWMLWVVPVDRTDRAVFEGFQSASRAFECYPHEDPWVLLPMLQGAAPAFGNDPFLRSCYAEKLSDLSFRASGFKDLSGSIGILQKGVQKGYPSANLYWRMGSFYRMLGDRNGASRAFEAARHAPLDLTGAGDESKGFE
jgi:hypothetical protein